MSEEYHRHRQLVWGGSVFPKSHRGHLLLTEQWWKCVSVCVKWGLHLQLGLGTLSEVTST